MATRGLLTVAVVIALCGALIGAADGKPKPKVVTEVPLKAGKVKPVQATLQQAKLAAKGQALVAAPGFKLVQLTPTKVGVVGSGVDINAVKIPLGSIIVIDDSMGETVLLCGGKSCHECEFTFETTTSETKCEGCGGGGDCTMTARKVAQ